MFFQAMNFKFCRTLRPSVRNELKHNYRVPRGNVTQRTEIKTSKKVTPPPAWYIAIHYSEIWVVKFIQIPQ